MDPDWVQREGGPGRRQQLQERKDLLYHTADGVVACKRKDEEKILHKHNLIILPQLYRRKCYSDRMINWGTRGYTRCNKEQYIGLIGQD